MDRHVLSVQVLFDTAEDAQRAAELVEEVGRLVLSTSSISTTVKAQGSAPAVPREPKGAH